ncbi:hypothetical protein BBAD15_g351 [Beauveria bassiana D1-5]|uniref:Uncharacterized protein n=1 Tax=Beauveria bassiana D1-5 TaxID=1245745 RepID=A0A0A2W5K6_BEABA|nr:hypothetical protein BBAD15_g351 [Beauveria bassiana D1-5]
MLIEEARENRHHGDTTAHGNGGVNGLQADNLPAFAGRDIAHRRQVANREAAAVQDLRHNQPRKFGGACHQAPANNAGHRGQQQQISGAPAAEQFVAEGKDNNFRHHPQ